MTGPGRRQCSLADANWVAVLWNVKRTTEPLLAGRGGQPGLQRRGHLLRLLKRRHVAAMLDHN